MPKFTVITATWNRSHHIIPTIRSVLAQNFTDFEYLIVGDCCSDDTEEIVRPFLSDRVRWLTTTERWHSQSGPNNVGVKNARGDFIAYIGHDDVWGADHLARHHAALSDYGRPDFSVAGCASYGSPGTGIVTVTGLDPTATLPGEYFFFPSAIAHRRDVTDRIGSWKRPEASHRNADVEFMVRGQNAGMTFVRNGHLTAHKFTAGDRYLSYLEPESFEQTGMLERLANIGSAEFLASVIADSKDQGRFVASSPIFDKGRKPGEGAQLSRLRRGVTVPPLVALRRSCDLPADTSFRGMDWHGRGPDRSGWQWSGPSPAPRILLPITAPDPVLIEFAVAHSDWLVPGRLRFRLNGTPVSASLGRARRLGNGWQVRVRLDATLRPDRASVLQIVQPPEALIGDKPVAKRGIAIGRITVRAKSAADKFQRAKIWLRERFARLSL